MLIYDNNTNINYIIILVLFDTVREKCDSVVMHVWSNSVHKLRQSKAILANHLCIPNIQNTKYKQYTVETMIIGDNKHHYQKTRKFVWIPQILLDK